MLRWGEELGRCHGYTVLAADGHPIGQVSWVEYQTRADCPASLVVRPRSIFKHRRAMIIATEEVAEVRGVDGLILLR